MKNPKDLAVPSRRAPGASARYRLGVLLNQLLPRRVCLALVEGIADGYGACSPRDRAAIRTNLEAILGHAVTPDSPLIREVFRNFARYLLEFFNAHRLPPASVEIEGYEHALEARRRSRGFIALSAHLGNWELGGITLGRLLGCPMTAVALPHLNPRVDRLVNRQRQRCGVAIIPLGPHASTACLATLHQGGVVGLIGDWQLDTPGISVTMYGRPVVLPRGPAVLSLRAGVPALPVFLLRTGRWRFRLLIRPPIWPDGAAVRTLTQCYADTFAQAIRLAPTQWLMFQPLAVPSLEGVVSDGPATVRADSQL